MSRFIQDEKGIVVIKDSRLSDSVVDDDGEPRSTTMSKSWDEGEHPRDGDGKFSESDSGSDSSLESSGNAVGEINAAPSGGGGFATREVDGYVVAPKYKHLRLKRGNDGDWEVEEDPDFNGSWSYVDSYPGSEEPGSLLKELMIESVSDMGLDHLPERQSSRLSGLVAGPTSDLEELTDGYLGDEFDHWIDDPEEWSGKYDNAYSFASDFEDTAKEQIGYYKDRIKAVAKEYNDTYTPHKEVMGDHAKIDASKALELIEELDAAVAEDKVALQSNYGILGGVQLKSKELLEETKNELESLFDGMREGISHAEDNAGEFLRDPGVFSKVFGGSQMAKWVTIGGAKKDGADHKGGTPVQIDDNGVILKGPKGFKGDHVSSPTKETGDRSSAPRPSQREDYNQRKESGGSQPAPKQTPSPREDYNRWRDSDLLEKSKSKVDRIFEEPKSENKSAFQRHKEKLGRRLLDIKIRATLHNGKNSYEGMILTHGGGWQSLGTFSSNETAKQAVEYAKERSKK